MKSIRSKLLKNFLIVIILTVVILDILALLCLKGYYYKNTQDTLVNQLEGYINFYQKYFSNNKLIDNIYENMDAFWNTNQEQIEILD
ncbi:MAG: two-component sensor histidine kinase, partial [Clostridium celatum]|nr:two-component sensor histidine kinase [Clostridium celatum]